MAELLEYVLALSVSTLLVGGSVAVYSDVAGLEGELQFRALFADITRLASAAAENGSSASAFAFPASTLSCAGGTISLDDGPNSESASIGSPCSFSLSVSAGIHELSFSLAASGITAVVD